MTSRKKPDVAFWATVVALLPLLHVASFGPACWLADRHAISDKWVSAAFSSFLSIAFKREGAPSAILNWWADIGARRDGAARRIVCREAAALYHCGSIDGCEEDDFEP